MLPKKQRLTRKAFQGVLFSGRRRHTPHVSFQMMGTTAPLAQFSFTVSKKTLPHAVGRNTLRRRGYAILRTLLPDTRRPVAGIFFFKKGSQTLSYDVLKNEIHTLLEQARVL